jgi:hypothetical protein
METDTQTTRLTEDEEQAIHAAIARKEGPVYPISQLPDDGIEWSLVHSVELQVGNREVRLQLDGHHRERALPAKKRKVRMGYWWCITTR